MEGNMLPSSDGSVDVEGSRVEAVAVAVAPSTVVASVVLVLVTVVDDENSVDSVVA
jgi:hypothetical protein